MDNARSWSLQLGMDQCQYDIINDVRSSSLLKIVFDFGSVFTLTGIRILGWYGGSVISRDMMSMLSC